MDGKGKGEKNKVYHQRRRKKLLYYKSITCICLFILMLTFVSSCRHGGYYTDSKGRRINTEAAEHYNQGNAYQRKGDYARSIAEYTRSLEIQPTAACYASRAVSYLYNFQFDQAIADANEAIALDPKDAHAYFIKGIACENKNRIQEAIEAYRAVLKYASDSPQDKDRVKIAKEHLTRLEKQR